MRRKKNTRKCNRVKSSAQGDKKFKEKPDVKWNKEGGDLGERPHPDKLPAGETVVKQHWGNAYTMEETIKNSCRYLNEREVPTPSSSRAWQFETQGSDFRVKDTRKGLWTLPPWLRRAAEARCVPDVCQHGGPERPLREAVKANPGTPMMMEMPESWDTCWGELLTGSGTSPRERSVLLSTKLKGVGALKSTLESVVETEFGVCPACFKACFGPVFSMFPFLPYGTAVYILWHSMLEISDLVFYFDFTVSLRRDFELWTFKQSSDW